MSGTKLSTKLLEVRVGQAKPLGNLPQLSAINKRKLMHAVKLSYLGIEGDHQADLKHHGGSDKAVHHYPAEHYAYWKQQLNKTETTIKTCMFGENISTIGLTEQNIHIGDIFKMGTATVQVSQGRQPCWKLNERFNIDDMALKTQTSLRTGWYYRVLEPGEIQADDTIELVERIEHDWPLSKLLHILYETPLDYKSLHEMTHIDSLTASWKKLAQTRISKQQVENWHFRLALK
jgi:MOSC domain-containing protein YiiM